MGAFDFAWPDGQPLVDGAFVVQLLHALAQVPVALTHWSQCIFGAYRLQVRLQGVKYRVQLAGSQPVLLGLLPLPASRRQRLDGPGRGAEIVADMVKIQIAPLAGCDSN